MPSLLIDIGANIARLQQDMAKAQGQITSFAKSTERTFSSLGNMVAAAGVTVGVQSMVQSFMDAERASMKMGVAMRNQGDYTRKAFEDLKEFAAQMQRTTAAEDDATLAVMANLKTYGMTNEELKRSTKAVLDLAAAKQDEGVTTERASEVIGRAYLGQTTALKRLGIVIGENIPQGEKFNTVMSQVEQRFGGAAAAELETYSGQWKKLKNDFGDVAEMLGIGVLKGIEGAMFGFSMVSVAFYKTLEAVSSGIGWFYEQVGKGASIVGLTSTANAAKAIADQMNGSAGGYAAIKDEALRMADANYTAMMSFDNVDRAVSKMRNGTRTTAPVDTKAAAEAAKQFQKDYIEGIEVIAWAADETAKQTEEQMKWFADQETDKIKALEKENAAWIKAGESAVDGMEKEIALGVSISKQSLDRIDGRLRAERDMYQDMRGFEQNYYTAVKLMIDSQAQKYRDLGINEATIEKWAQGEKLKAFDAYVDKAGTLYERLEKRARKYAEDAGDIHKGLFEAIDAGAKDLERQMSDNFFDALTGNMQRVSLDWDSMWQAMARSTSNYVAKIATDMAVSYGSKAVASGASWLWDLAGGASGISEVASSGWDSLVDFFTGFAEGSIEISEDKLARLHKGEMVVPAEQAAYLRDLFAGNGPSPEDAGFPDFAGFSLSPEMGYAVNQAAMGFMSGYGKAMLGKEIAALALTGTIANPVLGLMATARELMGAAFTGYAAYQEMASFRDIAELATEYGGNLAGGYMGGIGMDMGGYEADYGGGFSGVNDSEIGGEWRKGGIAIGPDTGYPATLHGTEAVVPLPDGKEIPVDVRGTDGAALPPVQLILQMDGRQVAEMLFKLSRSGVKVIHQNGITAI